MQTIQIADRQKLDVSELGPDASAAASDGLNLQNLLAPSSLSSKMILESQREAELASLVRGVPDIVYTFAKDAVLALASDERLSIFEIKALKRWQVQQGTLELRLGSDELIPISQKTATTLTVFIGASITHLDKNPWATDESKFFYSFPKIAVNRPLEKFAEIDSARVIEDRYGKDNKSYLSENWPEPARQRNRKSELSSRAIRSPAKLDLNEDRQRQQGNWGAEISLSCNDLRVPAIKEISTHYGAPEFQVLWQESENLRKELRKILDQARSQGNMPGSRAQISLEEASMSLRSVEKKFSYLERIDSRTRAGISMNFEIFERNFSQLKACTTGAVSSELDLQLQNCNLALIDFFRRLEELCVVAQHEKTRSP